METKESELRETEILFYITLYLIRPVLSYPLKWLTSKVFPLGVK